MKVLDILVAFVCLVIGVMAIVLGKTMSETMPQHPWLAPAIAVFFWISLAPVAAAAVIGWRIFTEIGRDNSFSHINAARLRTVSRLAAADTLWYVLGAAALYLTGVILPGPMLAMVCIVIFGVIAAAVAATLSHLTEKAAALKDENDLTI